MAHLQGDRGITVVDRNGGNGQGAALAGPAQTTGVGGVVLVVGVDAEVAVEGVGGMPQHLTVFSPGLPFGCGDQDAWTGDLFRLVGMQHRNAVELPAQGMAC